MVELSAGRTLTRFNPVLSCPSLFFVGSGLSSPHLASTTKPTMSRKFSIRATAVTWMTQCKCRPSCAHCVEQPGHVPCRNLLRAGIAQAAQRIGDALQLLPFGLVSGEVVANGALVGAVDGSLGFGVSAQEAGGATGDGGEGAGQAAGGAARLGGGLVGAHVDQTAGQDDRCGDGADHGPHVGIRSVQALTTSTTHGLPFFCRLRPCIDRLGCSTRYRRSHRAGVPGAVHRAPGPISSPRAGGRTSRSSTAHLASPPSPSSTHSARGCPERLGTPRDSTRRSLGRVNTPSG